MTTSYISPTQTVNSPTDKFLFQLGAYQGLAVPRDLTWQQAAYWGKQEGIWTAQEAEVTGIDLILLICTKDGSMGLIGHTGIAASQYKPTSAFPNGSYLTTPWHHVYPWHGENPEDELEAIQYCF